MIPSLIQISIKAVLESFILAAIGYFLVKKNVLKDAGLDALSRMVVELTLPLLIFCQLMQEFRFSAYPDWWIFPLMSIAITVIGTAAGLAAVGFMKRGREYKMQFTSLVAFQNSGYLPLALIVTLLPREQSGQMLIYLFLFLMGFNLVMWSVGSYMLNFSTEKKFEMGTVFSPPVIATLVSLLLVFFGLNSVFPDFVIRPLRMVGNCTLPLAMFVVGGSIAEIRLSRIDKKAMVLLNLVKIVILPSLGICLALFFNIPKLIGLLLVMQLAMPPATSLSVIARHYKKEDILIGQGIFFGHLAALVTLPLFLSLYFALVMIK
ncbi:MAG: AEC family transporter [Candidatus Omnitrophota bacterium]